MKSILFLVFTLLYMVSAQETDPYRLSHNVEPQFQFIHLNLNPDKENYSGYTEITLNIKRETSEFRMHGQDFNITKLELTQAKNNYPVEFGFQQFGLLNINAGRTLNPGKYIARFEFEGTISKKGEGICWFEKDSLNYLYTQMEDIYARQFYPCFDEPNFKFPVQIEITAPKQYLIVSNTPVEKETENGMDKTCLFKKTKPIPGYLVAFAVGPYETTEIPGLSVPGRIIVPKGYIQKSNYIKNITAQILRSLEDYFGIPYPYEKLDFVAVGNYNFGAMENPGIIVYLENYLIDPPKISLIGQYSNASVTVHELAHMWFGNIVTMQWWEDTWLNEGLTSWIEGEIMLKDFPDLKPMDRMVSSFNSALNIDRTENTTAIARTIKGDEQPEDAFDALSYNKSQVVMRMIENWIGRGDFQRGLASYFNLYKWKNATSDQFIETMSKASGKNVSRIMNDFIKQPGVPIVTAEVNGNKIKLRQDRLKTVEITKDFNETWLIPFSLKINDGQKTYLKKIVLGKKEQEFIFNDVSKIEWFHLKDNFIGYFIENLPVNILKKAILSGELNDAEVMDLFIGLRYGFQSGKINPVDILELVSELKDTKSKSLASALAPPMSEIRYVYGSKTGVDIFNNYVDKTAIPLLNTIGSEADLSYTISERNAQYNLINMLQNNASVVQRTSDLARKYLKQETLSSWSYLPFLETLFYNFPDDFLYQTVKNKILTTTVASEKNTLMRAIGNFPGKYVKQTLDMALKANLEPNDRISISRFMAIGEFRRKFQTGKSENNLIAWVKEHEDFLKQTVSEASLNWMLPGMIFDMDDLKDFDTYFPQEDRSKSMEIGIAKIKSDIIRNVKLQEMYLEDVKRYLVQLHNGLSTGN